MKKNASRVGNTLRPLVDAVWCMWWFPAVWLMMRKPSVILFIQVGLWLILGCCIVMGKRTNSVGESNDP